MSRSIRRSRRRALVSPRRTRSHRGPPPLNALLRVTVEQHATVALVRVIGEFDIAGVETVERALRGAVDRLTDQVVIDLRAVSFFDLAGLETVLRADERARRGSYGLAVVPPPGLGSRILSLTHAERCLTLINAPPV